MLKTVRKYDDTRLGKAVFLALFCGLMIALFALPAEAGTVDSGTCGDHLTWTLDDAGTLTISGTGEMAKFYKPWGDHKSAIKSVFINEGMTEIGDLAFQNCFNLTSISIPNSVTSIGIGAFNGCTNLTCVTIPSSVTDIGDSAFLKCSSLSTISIPDSVTSIGVGAFSECSSLSSFIIPDSVTSIGEGAFMNCSGLTSIIIPQSVTSIGKAVCSGCSGLTNIFVSADNDFYCSIDGTLYNKSQTIIICYPVGKTNSSYTIPGSVTSIGFLAFYGSGLTSITIPESVAMINENAFLGCNNLTTVQYSGTAEQWGNISIGSGNENLLYAADCSGFVSIVQSGSCGDNLTWTLNNVETLTISGTGAMYDYGHISDLPWYAQKSIIKSVIIKNGVTNIGEGAFYECLNLTSVTIPDSVTSIGLGSFMECSSLTSVTIPNNVTSIGMGAFAMCENLTSITIPYSVTSIGEAAFYGCSCLERIYFTGSMIQWFDIEIEADNNELNSANISFAIDFISSKFISGGNLSNRIVWRLSESGQLSIDGMGDMPEFSGIPWEAYISDIKELFIQEGITRISNYAFRDIINLTDVTISSGVTSIGNGAFSGCNSLERIIIPESVNDIGDFPFSSNVKVYCYEYSYAQFWAEDNGYTVVLLDDGNINDLVTVTLPENKTVMVRTACYMGGTVFPVTEEVIIVWTSSAPDVAEVNQDGILTAWKAGTTTVTMSAGEKTVQCLVTVVQGAEHFDIESDIYVATTKTIPVSLFNITPSDATLDLTWTTGNTVYATVSQAGLVTGKAVGETQLTVTDSISGLSRTATIHICYPVHSISLALADNPVYAGFPTAVTALVTTTKGQSYVNKLVSFSSSDTNIAAVDQQGNIQTFEPGTVTITATAANGVTANCILTVKAIQYILSLPTNLGEIENEAFVGLTAVEAIRIPEGVYYIADDAFAGSDVIILAPAGSFAESWAREHGMTVIGE